MRQGLPELLRSWKAHILLNACTFVLPDSRHLMLNTCAPFLMLQHGRMILGLVNRATCSSRHSCCRCHVSSSITIAGHRYFGMHLRETPAKGIGRAGGHIVVQSSGDPSRGEALLHARGYLVHRLHLRGDDQPAAALPRGLCASTPLPCPARICSGLCLCQHSLIASSASGTRSKLQQTHSLCPAVHSTLLGV